MPLIELSQFKFITTQQNSTYYVGAVVDSPTGSAEVKLIRSESELDNYFPDLLYRTGYLSLLNAGASAIYYVRDEEKFLLPAILSEMSYSSGFSEETKNEVTQILLDSLNEKELSGLIPAHSNMLIQQMLPYEEELNKLLMKGLNFQQDINNHYGSDAIEITAVKRANVNFFLKLVQNILMLFFFF